MNAVEKYIVTSCATLSDIRTILEDQNLYVVSASDKAVLDAMRSAAIAYKEKPGVRILTYTQDDIEKACMLEIKARGK